MKISAFTFIQNGSIYNYPFLESIHSVLPIIDEFVINVGEGEDNTLELIKAINSPKIRIIESKWNDNMRHRGFVYGQQKTIAQFNCTGDWAFYLEGDEIVHEDDLQKIQDTCKKHLNDEGVEALTFDYLHFYGNANSYLDSPAWYRREARIIRNSIRSYAPGGLYWHVLTNKTKICRYPYAAHSNAKIYHYGWVRNEEQMNLKSEKVQKYWDKAHKQINYSEIDQAIIKEFRGTHPKAIQNWLPKEEGLFQANPDHKLTKREKKHRIMLKIEQMFGVELSKKHYKKAKL